MPQLCAALLLAWPSAAGAADRSFPRLVEAFEQRGFTVLENDPRCGERGLFGFVRRGSRRIVVCPRGDRSDTLLHEGWHAVQALCLRGVPLLSDEQLQRGLSRADRRDLERLYGSGRWQREAEARVMARQEPSAYFRLVDALCGIPAAPAPEQKGHSEAAPGSTSSGFWPNRPWHVI